MKMTNVPDVFHMSCLRKILKTFCRDKIRNDGVNKNLEESVESNKIEKNKVLKQRKTGTKTKQMLSLPGK